MPPSGVCVSSSNGYTAGWLCRAACVTVAAAANRVYLEVPAVRFSGAIKISRVLGVRSY